MRKHLLRIKAFWIGLLLLGCTTAVAQPTTFEAGNLVLHDNGSLLPTKLPRSRQAPASAWLKAGITTKDGSHPPAARELVIDFDKNIEVNAQGLPVCKRSQLVSQTTAAAKKACPGAIVGSGDGDVEVAFPEQTPFTATGPIVAFNGGVHGGTTLLFIHAYVAVPTPTAILTTVKITHIDRGRFGLHSVTQIPVITGGAGSVTRFRLKLGRRFTYAGKQQSYLTGSCPTGTYFIDGHAHFSDGTVVHVTHALPCTPTA